VRTFREDLRLKSGARMKRVGRIGRYSQRIKNNAQRCSDKGGGSNFDKRLLLIFEK
jgi:hypothetical protein